MTPRLSPMLFVLACEALEEELQRAMDCSIAAARSGDAAGETSADRAVDRALAQMERLIEGQLAVRGEQRPAAPRMEQAA